MKKNVKEQAFIKKPYYEGGDKAFGEFIMQNLQYPKDAVEKKIEGTVTVKYDIDYKGNVIAAKAISGIGFGCDEEAVRVVKLLKFTVPKQGQNLKVIFHKTTYIRFALDKSHTTKVIENQPQANLNPVSSMTIQYSIVPTKQEETQQNAPQTASKSGSYSYTVTY